MPLPPIRQLSKLASKPKIDRSWILIDKDLVVRADESNRFLNKTVRWSSMQQFRLFIFCAVIAAFFHAGPLRADDKGTLIGRWQLDKNHLSDSEPFTMDVVSCGEHLCGIWVNKGKCDRMVLKPYNRARDGKTATDLSAEEHYYIYSRPDLNDEYVVSVSGVSDHSFSFYGENERSFEKRKGSWLTIQTGEREFGMTEYFKRLGPAECKLPIS